MNSKTRRAHAQAVARRWWLFTFVGVPVFGMALLAMIALDIRRPVPPELLVSVYRTHGCHCALSWIRSLEAEGFTVHRYEPGSLFAIRYKLGVPKHLKSCHVAHYMGYFLEGHVPAAALRQLARERPEVRGVAMASSTSNAADLDHGLGSGIALLIDQSGNSKPWQVSATGDSAAL